MSPNISAPQPSSTVASPASDPQWRAQELLLMREVMPVIAVDVRLVAATHRDLETDVTQGSFRRDLFYRLNVIPIRLPSLRERREDIRTLALHFLNRANQANQRNVNLAGDALARLEAHPWPGTTATSPVQPRHWV